MLPFLGPSTVRDATAKLTVDRLTNPANYHDESLAFTALKLLDKRADILSDEEAFKDISDDQYSALRDLWLQRRASEIRDGKVDEQEQSDLIDELEALDDE
jgi:phospholipid-binding lipoprotein MlaA